MNEVVLSVDLGGTNMRAAIVDLDGTVLVRATKATPRHARCPDALEQLMESVAEQARDHGTYDGIVVGVPGRVDYRDGQLEHAPNLPATWLPDLTEANLGGHFGVPVFLANDADLAAVGESYFGAGRQYTDVVYVTISTGVGAGVVLGGALVRGTRSLAEVGHTILSVDQLGNGGPATVEELASGTALARIAHDHGLGVAGAELAAMVRDGHTLACSVWAQVMEAAGAAVVNLAHLFGPDVIVIGGGLGRNGDLVHQPIGELLKRNGPQGLDRPIVLAEAALGDDAGLVGGAAWAQALDVKR